MPGSDLAEDPAEPTERVAEPAAKQWSLEEVSRWITEVGNGRLAYLVGSFEENGVDGELLLDLSSEDACAELGVKHIHRKMLLREVDKLREPNDFTQ